MLSTANRAPAQDQQTHKDKIEFHPLANLFPLIEGAEFDELVADIKAHGLRQPIYTLDGKILDGRNRYRACLKAGVQHRIMPYQGKDPLAFVISSNLHRRHLSESQRAMVAAKLANLGHGGNRSKSPIGDLKVSQTAAADMLNVGKRSVERATEVRDHGAPELQQAVERGEVSVTAAADVAALPQEQQTEIVARGEREILLASKEIRGRRAEKRRAERIERIAEISKSNKALDIEKKYPVILADPPWYFEPYSGNGRAFPYPTMTIEEICALPVRDIAYDDSILFLWTASSHLQLAFRVMEAWGFRYSTNAVWTKSDCAPGLGHVFRQQHEMLLVARCGELPNPPPNVRPSSIISAPRREHSRKPDEAYELIERMYPELPKIELFARNSRPGWAVWGNEVPTDNLEIPTFLRRSS
jgi:N6-adenosine-specific RNA methylase IME4